MSRLLLYDTSNFIDFPIGGQLTSIGNFLRFLCETKPERIKDVLLVGITKKPEEVGRKKTLSLYGGQFSFLPVTACGGDLANAATSLRLSYAKGLLRHKKVLAIQKSDCNYIHTPEAYGVVKLCCIRATCVIFSHGSYFNMERGFRFFQKNVLIKKAFVQYLKWILRNAAMIFVLDQSCKREYEGYNKQLVTVGNSVVVPTFTAQHKRTRTKETPNLLFVGRFSKDKRIKEIIEAALLIPGATLTIVGDGEEHESLIRYEGERIIFAGAVPPAQVGAYMERADVLIMNSTFEGIPMTILEALSYGLPVVSTRVGGIPEALRFGKDGLESDGTPESIRAAVLLIMDQYDFYAEHALAHGKDFDYRQVGKKIYDALERFWKEHDY